jgi:Ni/Fe-hydrogenase subunit HybB-like protein
MSTHVRDDTARLQGPIMTRFTALLLAVTLVWLVLVIYRFIVGIGPVSAMNDGYAWGSWKVFNVIVLTALASGGYATATVVYVLNRGRYHSLIRTAILTSLLGYTTAMIALGMDVGRPWNMWRIMNPLGWNLHSVLLEIAVCVMLYAGFLWLEMSYPALDRWSRSEDSRLQRFAARFHPIMEKSYPFIVATAIFLPTLHQSSLGSLFLLAGPRLHILWQTPLLPLFFLIAAFVMGFSAVIGVSLLSSFYWKTPYQTPMLARVARLMAWLMIAMAVGRYIDWAARGQLELLFQADTYALLAWLETALLMLPALFILFRNVSGARDLYLAAGGAALGGMLYRLDASLIAFAPGPRYQYFPSIVEIFLTFGLICIAVLGYILFVKLLPILPARRSVGHDDRPTFETAT